MYSKTNTMKKDFIEEKVFGDYKVRTFHDESPESPREWDNVGTMVCFHRRYNLGDKTDYRSEDYNSWDELKQGIMENEGEVFILPLYLFDHSGISISTSSFNCNWDSGQVGFIFVSKYKIQEEGIEEKYVQECLENEVKTYNQYLQGEVYGCEVVKVTTCNFGHEHEELIHSCYGFYNEDECLEEGMGYVKYDMKEI